MELKDQVAGIPPAWQVQNAIYETFTIAVHMRPSDLSEVDGDERVAEGEAVAADCHRAQCAHPDADRRAVLNG